MDKSTHRRRLPRQIAHAIAAILDYHWQDEARDYLSRTREEQATHIFNDMLAVRHWLERGIGQAAGPQSRRKRT